MEQEGISLNAISYVCILKICGNLGYVDKGISIHAEIAKKGLEKEVLLGSSLVDIYAKCGLVGEAEDIFSKLPVRNLLTWNVLISGWCEHGHGEKALGCYDRLQLEGLSPNIITFVSVLKASGSIGATMKASQIYVEVSTKGLESEGLISNTLIDTYAKCGMLVEAKVIFDRLPCADVVSWTTLITGYGQLGESGIVFELCDRMIEVGTEPNTDTLVTILNACSLHC